jgi:hypothetical protein
VTVLFHNNIEGGARDGWFIWIVMDSSFGELGTTLREKNDKYLHCWVRLVGDIFLSTQKTYHSLRCTISRNYHGRCC